MHPWGTSCTKQWLVVVFASIINIISDVTVLIIPVVSGWKLQMSRSKKWAVVSLFTLCDSRPVGEHCQTCLPGGHGRGRGQNGCIPPGGCRASGGDYRRLLASHELLGVSDQREAWGGKEWHTCHVVTIPSGLGEFEGWKGSTNTATY